MHVHEFQGQKLRHDHEGGDQPHGYYEHAEDGCRPAPLAGMDIKGLSALVQAQMPLPEAVTSALAAADAEQEGHYAALVALADAVRAHARPAPAEVTGECGWCERSAVRLVAVLASDPDTEVCALCHADDRVPTISRAAITDERPVYVITRGDLAGWAWRDVTDGEVAEVVKSIDHAEVSRRVQAAVFGVCGTPPALLALIDAEPDDRF